MISNFPENGGEMDHDCRRPRGREDLMIQRNAAEVYRNRHCRAGRHESFDFLDFVFPCWTSTVNRQRYNYKEFRDWGTYTHDANDERAPLLYPVLPLLTHLTLRAEEPYSTGCTRGGRLREVSENVGSHAHRGHEAWGGRRSYHRQSSDDPEWRVFEPSHQGCC